ncbi:MAG: type IX secretion system outer membrane channel protein PorV [Saprospiraceae bacterium]
MSTFLNQRQQPLFAPITFLSTIILLSLPFLGHSQCFLNTATNQFETATGEPCVNTIITAVPFLRIAPDARSAGMGDAGIAVSADASALHFNASKLVFAEEKAGFGLTYTPWLRALEADDSLKNNFYLGYASGYVQIDPLNAIGLGIRYFSLGEMVFVDENGVPIGIGKSDELEINVSFARKFAERFSAGLGVKYIYSNLAGGISGINAGSSIATDFSFTYQTPVLTIGLAATNLGQRITYTSSINKDFIPANLGLGIAWNKALNENTKLTLTTDINKLLAPTPDPAGADENFDGVPDYRQRAYLPSVLGSFSDAPGGFSEELRELMFSFGAEVQFRDFLAARVGYFTEHSTKGGRKYLTTGLGYTYKFITLNGAYLVTTKSERSPLDNTFRVSLLFAFNNQNR